MYPRCVFQSEQYCLKYNCTWLGGSWIKYCFQPHKCSDFLYFDINVLIWRCHIHAGGRLRHAFIGIGFRERTQAYDFQAALHDHAKYYSISLWFIWDVQSFLGSFGHVVKWRNDSHKTNIGIFWRYLDKKKTAEEMEQHYQHTPSVDYSLKEGETLVIQIGHVSILFFPIVMLPKLGWVITFCSLHPQKSKSTKSNVPGGLNNLAIEEKGNGTLAKPVVCLKPPPPPSAPVSPGGSVRALPSGYASDGSDREGNPCTAEVSKHSDPIDNQRAVDAVDDDFGDFQTAV